MKYLDKKFNSPAANAAYRDNWDRIFGEPEEPLYPCSRCGVLRTKAEGGTLTAFSLCDDCWDRSVKIDPTLTPEQILEDSERDAAAIHDEAWHDQYTCPTCNPFCGCGQCGECAGAPMPKCTK